LEWYTEKVNSAISLPDMLSPTSPEVQIIQAFLTPDLEGYKALWSFLQTQLPEGICLEISIPEH